MRGFSRAGQVWREVGGRAGAGGDEIDEGVDMSGRFGAVVILDWLVAMRTNVRVGGQELVGVVA